MREFPLAPKIDEFSVLDKKRGEHLFVSVSHSLVGVLSVNENEGLKGEAD